MGAVISQDSQELKAIDPSTSGLCVPEANTRVDEQLKKNLVSYGVDSNILETVLDIALSSGQMDSRAIRSQLDQRRDEIIKSSDIETRARVTRRGFLAIEHPATAEESLFIQQCSGLQTNELPGYATVSPPDSETIKLLGDKLKFQLAPQGSDNREISVIGDMSRLSSEVEGLLINAGVSDPDLLDATVLAVTRRVAVVMRGLNSDSASVIVTCRTRRGEGDDELLPHFDGNFDPKKEPNTLEFKAVSVLTGPTTKVWNENDFDRDKAIAACDHTSSLAQEARQELLMESIKDSKPQSLANGEVLVFQAGDSNQATLHTIPAFPPFMDRLIIQINPLPFSSIESVWWNDQMGRVERALAKPAL